MADSGYNKYGWPEMTFETYEILPHFIMDKDGKLTYVDKNRSQWKPAYIEEEYKIPEHYHWTIDSGCKAIKKKGDIMKDFSGPQFTCDEYEGTTEAIYIVCVPGSTECKVMVNMKERKLDISYNMEYALDKVRIIPKTKTIKVPEVYNLLKVKKEIANGILRITIPVDEGYVFEVK